MNKKSFTCVVCPIGCELCVEYDQSCVFVSGNSCKRGEAYAKAEVTCPERTLTTTIKTNSKKLPLLPVKTDLPIPKERLFEAMKIANSLCINLPIRSGEIIVKDFIKQGVNLVACRTVDKH